MPGTHMELKTKIVKNNLNPVYNDEFSFVLSPNDVRKKTIVFQVYDKDTIGKDDGIGDIQIPLWQVDLDIETDNTMELSAVTKGKDNKPVLIARRPPGDAGSISSRSSVTSLIGQGSNAGGWNVERNSASSYQAGNTGYHSSYSQEQHTYTSGSTVRESSHSSAHGSRLGSSSSSSDEEARRSVSHSSTTYTTSTGYSGGMSLHELNNRLERYINQIQLNPGDPQVSINVDRISEGGSFDIHGMPQYHEYERMLREYTEQEEELARVEAEITILTQDNTDYRDRLGKLEEKLRLKKIEIPNLEIEIKNFESSRRSAESALIDTKQHNARVSVKQEQARFIDSLSTLHFKSVTTTEEMVDEDKVRAEIKEEYNKRLEIEKEKIRHLYKSYERDMTQSIKSIFDAKIAELQKLKAHWS